MSKKKIGEGDLLLFIYGKQKGKVIVKAPGALKIKNRLRGRAEIFTVGKGYFIKRKELDLLINWEVIERFNSIVEDFSKFLLVSKFIKEVERFIPLEVKDLDIYNTIYYFLKHWEKLDEILGNIFVIKILQKLGYLSPILLTCQRCGKDLSSEERIYVDISNNKAFCIKCNNKGFYFIDMQVVREYNTILSMDFKDIVEGETDTFLKDIKILDILTKMKRKVEEEV